MRRVGCLPESDADDIAGADFRHERERRKTKARRAHRLQRAFDLDGNGLAGWKAHGYALSIGGEPTAPRDGEYF